MANEIQKTCDLVGLGNALLDRIAEIDDAFLAHHGIIKGTMDMTKADVMSGLQTQIKLVKESSGGALANCLAGASLLGSRTAFIGKVGDDAQGRSFISDLKAQKVIFAGGTADEMTGVCLVLITPDAQRSMRTSLGAAAALTREDVDENLISRAKILYLESYLWDSPSAVGAVMRAADIARENQTMIALNLSDPLCVDRHRAALTAFVAAKTDILIGNELEICAFHSVADFDAAEKASLALNLSFAALTRSQEGSVVLAKGKSHFIPAIENIKAIDTTGAGDLYAAGFLHTLAAGGAEAAIKGGHLGAQMAAAIVQIHGARLPDDFSL